MTKTLLAFSFLALFALTADARLIEIQFTGLDFRYDGTDLFDNGGRDGGNGNAAEADRLTTMSFLVDEDGDGILDLAGVLQNQIYVDFLLSGVTQIPAVGGLVNKLGAGGAGSFGFDLLVPTSDTTSGFGLGLAVDAYQVVYFGNKLSIAATEVASNLRVQNLPFGLEISPTDQITIIISSANLSDVVDDGTYLTEFHASGTGNVRGTEVPEPSGVVLLVLSAGAMFRSFGSKKS